MSVGAIQLEVREGGLSEQRTEEQEGSLPWVESGEEHSRQTEEKVRSAEAPRQARAWWVNTQVTQGGRTECGTVGEGKPSVFKAAEGLVRDLEAKFWRSGKEAVGRIYAEEY